MRASRELNGVVIGKIARAIAHWLHVAAYELEGRFPDPLDEKLRRIFGELPHPGGRLHRKVAGD